MENENKLKFLLEMYSDVRQEIKQRIAQRDSFGVQLIVACGVLIAIGFTDKPYSSIAFLLLPFISWFYNSLINYSYKLHVQLTDFLRGDFSKEIINVAGYSEKDLTKFYWEGYVKGEEKKVSLKLSGVRRNFFMVFNFAIPVIAEVLFLLTAYRNFFKVWQIAIIMPISFAIYVALTLIILYKKKKEKKEEKEK